MPAELVEKEFWIHLKETERLIRLEGLGNEWQNKGNATSKRNSVWYEFIFKILKLYSYAKVYYFS